MGSDVLSLIIFVACLILFIWNKWSFAVVALLGLSAMILTGVCTFQAGFKSFGSTTTILIASMMVVGRAVFQTGLARIVGEKIMKYAGSSELRVIVIAALVTTVLSAFLQNSATLTIMIYISAGICSANRNIRFKNIVMPIAISSVFGGMLTLVGSTPQLTANGLLEEYLGSGNGFSFFTLTIPALAVSVVMIVYVALIGYSLGKKIWGHREDYASLPSAEAASEAIAANSGKLRIMTGIFAITVLMFLCSDFIADIIPGMNLAIIGLLSALSCVLTGCITGGEAICSINWKLIIWLSASVGIGGALTSGGGGTLMANAFLGLLGTDIPAFPLFVAFVVLAAAITQVLNNSTVITMLLPIMFSMTAELGYDPFAFAVGITLGACVAVLTPLANNTIALSMLAGYRFSDYIKYGAIVTVGGVTAVCAVIPLIFPLV